MTLERARVKHLNARAERFENKAARLKLAIIAAMQAIELKKLQRALGITFIHVTHDQIEALTFADQVVVMTRGKVVQMGTPEELFETPQHTFVGYFIGSPGMNQALSSSASAPASCISLPSSTPNWSKGLMPSSTALAKVRCS